MGIGLTLRVSSVAVLGMTLSWWMAPSWSLAVRALASATFLWKAWQIRKQPQCKTELFQHCSQDSSTHRPLSESVLSLSVMVQALLFQKFKKSKSQKKTTSQIKSNANKKCPTWHPESCTSEVLQEKKTEIILKVLEGACISLRRSSQQWEGEEYK